MKGFIEVSNDCGFYSVNINHITYFGDKYILLYDMSFENTVNESYEQIKELIKQAQ